MRMASSTACRPAATRRACCASARPGCAASTANTVSCVRAAAAPVKAETGSVPARLSRARRFAGRARTRCRRTMRRGAAADPPAFARGRVTYPVAAAGTAPLAAAAFPVDRRPGAPFGFAARHATPLVAFFDVARLALLLVRVTRLAAARHDGLLLSWTSAD